jgi:hypothetical protein
VESRDDALLQVVDRFVQESDSWPPTGTPRRSEKPARDQPGGPSHGEVRQMGRKLYPVNYTQ